MTPPDEILRTKYSKLKPPGQLYGTPGWALKLYFFIAFFSTKPGMTQYRK
jgi:hypothetical protein